MAGFTGVVIYALTVLEMFMIKSQNWFTVWEKLHVKDYVAMNFCSV
jgi:hypothetical protein